MWQWPSLNGHQCWFPLYTLLQSAQVIQSPDPAWRKKQRKTCPAHCPTCQNSLVHLFPPGDHHLWYPTLQQPPPSPQESSQVGTIEVTAHSSCSPSPLPATLERNGTPNPLELQANSITLPGDVLYLQDEMNDTMVHLLTFRASVDAHWQRLISGPEITHCQNETKISKAINRVEAHYAVALCNTEAIYTAAMREVEADSSASPREAEAAHATAVREAEAARMAQTCKLWQAHLETMQTLEDKALKEKRHSSLSFPWACGVALQACPNEALGILMYSIHLLTGNMSLSGLLMAALQLTIGSRDPIHSPSHPRRPATTTPPTGNKQQPLSRCEEELDHSGEGEPTSHPRELPQQRLREEDPLAGHPSGSLPQGLRPSQAYKVD